MHEYQQQQHHHHHHHHHHITRILTVARNLPLDVAVDHTIQQHLQVDLDDHPYANLLEIAEACCQFIDQAEKDAMMNATMTTTTSSSKSSRLNEEEDGISTTDDSATAPPSILVHCASGASRSVSIIIAWLITRKNYSLEEALSVVRKNRDLADPNDGFIQRGP